MIQRSILQSLNKWKTAERRKPLVMRGARQVGKTTIVKEFGKSFDNFLYLNLDDRYDKDIMEAQMPLSDKIGFIFAQKGVLRNEGTTLLFIDEIQNSPKTISLLRYFYEEHPEIHVVSAGSLLENVVDVNASFPVGRVEYLPVRPCSFREFAMAMGKQNLLDIIDNYPFQTPAVHTELMSLFQQYVIIGGMPEIVASYAESHDILAMDNLYETLLQAYNDDVVKYVKANKTGGAVRHILDKGWSMAGETISMEAFGNGIYRSRELGEAFRLLTKAMLLELVYPSSSAVQPALADYRRSPKLIWLDTGLVNYAAGIRQTVIGAKDLLDVWRGRIGEQIVAQELLTLNEKITQKRYFWSVGKGNDGAEVDLVWTIDSQLFPIEVKTGHNSHLRSLHSFMEKSPVDIGIRVWSGPLSVNDVETTIKKKPFRLLNLPFYMVCNIEKIVMAL